MCNNYDDSSGSGDDDEGDAGDDDDGDDDDGYDYDDDISIYMYHSIADVVKHTI